MPTYEYACKACSEHLEVVQSFKDDPLTEGPHCKGELRKVFSPIGIAFKGSGFYKTDSRSSASKPAEGKSESKPAESKPAESKSSEKSSEKSSDKKSPDKKSEAKSAAS